MFGFSKVFVIFLFISLIFSIGTRSWQNFLVLMITYALIVVVWRILTRKNG